MHFGIYFAYKILLNNIYINMQLEVMQQTKDISFIFIIIFANTN